MADSGMNFQRDLEAQQLGPGLRRLLSQERCRAAYGLVGGTGPYRPTDVSGRTSAGHDM